jgi:hypothetical protein
MFHINWCNCASCAFKHSSALQSTGLKVKSWWHGNHHSYSAPSIFWHYGQPDDVRWKIGYRRLYGRRYKIVLSVYSEAHTAKFKPSTKWWMPQKSISVISTLQLGMTSFILSEGKAEFLLKGFTLEHHSTTVVPWESSSKREVSKIDIDAVAHEWVFIVTPIFSTFWGCSLFWLYQLTF